MSSKKEINIYTPPPPSSPHIERRNSGVELLKVCAIFLVLIAHYTLTLVSNNPYFKDNSYVISINVCGTSVQHFMLVLLYQIGMFGDEIFFISSAWFLTESRKAKKKKIIGMLFDNWILSVISPVFALIVLKMRIDSHTMLYSLLPTTLGSHWYITAYLLFYAFHPFLNKIIDNIGQREHFRLSTVMCVLYIFICSIKGSLFFLSTLTIWITIYFFISYAKRYLKPQMESFKLNIFFAIGGIVGNILLVVLTNVLGLHISFLSDKGLHWTTMNNPFIILATLGLFNLARKIKWQNKVVNYISSLSFFIYIIHGHIVFSRCLRPLSLLLIHSHFGYTHIVAWLLVLSIGLFIICALLGMVYKETVHHLLQRIIASNYEHLCYFWRKAEDKLLGNITENIET